jgi:phosphatidylglycerophosphate synthase
MTTSVLLALTAAEDGRPACLQVRDGTTLVADLSARLAAYGEVTVIAWTSWAPVIRAALPVDADVIEVATTAKAIRHAVAFGGDDPVVVLDAHLVADDVSLGHLADGAASSTAAVVGRAGEHLGAPVRTARGRIVAAGSVHHRLDHADAVAARAVRLSPRDHARVVAHAGELAGLLAAPPPAWCADPADDVAALLLVALVRGGVPVGVQALPRGGVWAHPTSAAAVADGGAALAEVDEERLRLDTAVKADDGFFTTFAVSPYSRYWARWAARRGITPNQVTTASMVLGVLAALAFATGDLAATVVGALLLQLAFTLDCVDGQLARYSRRFSAFGGWLDSVFDRGKEYAVLAGLAAGGVRAGDADGLWLLAAAALALQTFRHALDFGYAEQQTADLARDVVQPLATVGEAGPSTWEAVPETTAPDRGGRGGRARAVIGLLRRAEGIGVLRWAKRIVVLPIGERFLLISVVAVLAGPRAVFVALLAWGGLATLYTFGGRLVRSVA